MKQSVKILNQNCCEDLLTFTSNPEIRQRYNHEIYDTSSFEYLKIPTKYFIDDDLELGTSSKDDCKNSITIFKQLIKLDKVQANDKRLWTCLTHKWFYKYTKKRWNINENSSDDTIISRFHYEGSSIEARMRNAISRLWWAAKITYDEKRENNFELTELIWEKQDVFMALVERSYVSYPNILHGFLEFFNKNKHLKEDQLRFILRGLNTIGGVKVLPLLNKQEINDEIKRLASFRKIEVK